ncbi:MAG: hypothetical protein JXA78_09295 [Anaerolineales bacterium]|nr:hypothetical protein [Anaerolineales bacterium]
MFRNTGFFAFVGALLWLLLLGLVGFGLYQAGFANGYNQAALAAQEGGATLTSPFSGWGAALLIAGLIYLAGFVLVLPWRTHWQMRSRWHNLPPEQWQAFHKRWQAACGGDWAQPAGTPPSAGEAPRPEEA